MACDNQQIPTLRQVNYFPILFFSDKTQIIIYLVQEKCVFNAAVRLFYFKLQIFLFFFSLEGCKLIMRHHQTIYFLSLFPGPYHPWDPREQAAPFLPVWFCRSEVSVVSHKLTKLGCESHLWAKSGSSSSNH